MLESAHLARAVASVVGVSAGVLIDEGAVEGAVDEAGELARGGGEGLGRVDTDGEASGPPGWRKVGCGRGGGGRRTRGCVRVALAGDEVAEDRQAGLADDGAADAREQQVHLGEALLHALDKGAGGLDENIAMAHARAEGEDRAGGAAAPTQETHRVELAEPLAVLDSALAAGDVLAGVGVDEQDFEAPGFEDLEDGDPVDAGGFPGDAGDATGDEPIGEAVEVSGAGAKGRTDVESRSGGTATSCSLAPQSRPATSTWMRSSTEDERVDRRRLCFMASSCILRGASGTREAVWRALS